MLNLPTKICKFSIPLYSFVIFRTLYLETIVLNILYSNLELVYLSHELKFLSLPVHFFSLTVYFLWRSYIYTNSFLLRIYMLCFSTTLLSTFLCFICITHRQGIAMFFVVAVIAIISIIPYLWIKTPSESTFNIIIRLYICFLYGTYF